MNGGELLKGVDFVAPRTKHSQRGHLLQHREGGAPRHSEVLRRRGRHRRHHRSPIRRHAGHEGRKGARPRRPRPHPRPGRQAGPSSRASAKRKATPSSTSTRPRRATSSTAPSAASRAAPPPSASARPRRCCRAANRSPARRTTSASASRQSSSKCKRVGHRVRIILSRTHPDFVRRLFENEIPEIGDRTIEIKAVAREAGYRTKVAVSSIDMKVDCVGACVGVRGSRIKNIVDELGGERIDIVRWNDALQVLIPNGLAAGPDRGGVPLSAAGTGHRAGEGGPAVAGHRPARPERPAGVEARRLGHRDHDARRAERGHRAGRGLVLAGPRRDA